ncbi:CBS domain-containing protein [Pseudonocardia saturnea]
MRDIMTRPVLTVPPGTPVRAVAALLSGRGFTALPVVDDAGDLIGIVTEADLLRDRLRHDPRSPLLSRELAAGGPPSRVSEVMTTDVVTAQTWTDVADLVAEMQDRGAGAPARQRPSPGGATRREGRTALRGPPPVPPSGPVPVRDSRRLGHLGELTTSRQSSNVAAAAADSPVVRRPAIAHRMRGSRMSGDRAQAALHVTSTLRSGSEATLAVAGTVDRVAGAGRVAGDDERVRRAPARQGPPHLPRRLRAAAGGEHSVI